MLFEFAFRKKVDSLPFDAVKIKQFYNIAVTPTRKIKVQKMASVFKNGLNLAYTHLQTVA